MRRLRAAMNGMRTGRKDFSGFLAAVMTKKMGFTRSVVEPSLYAGTWVRGRRAGPADGRGSLT
eukprot:8872737-Alexandrium_andersonii.AAC.1